MSARRRRVVIGDFCIAEDAFEHRKTKRLRRELGEDFYAGWYSLTRIWRWATCRGGAAEDPVAAHLEGRIGDLGTSVQDIEDEAEWTGADGALVDALVKSGHLEEVEDPVDTGLKRYRIANLAENQPHLEGTINKILKSRENGRLGGRPSIGKDDNHRAGNPEKTQTKPSKTQGNPSGTGKKPKRTQANLQEPSEADAPLRGEEASEQSPDSDAGGSRSGGVAELDSAPPHHASPEQASPTPSDENPETTAQRNARLRESLEASDRLLADLDARRAAAAEDGDP